MHAQRREEQTWRRKWRDESDVEEVLVGLSALSSVLALPLCSLLASVSWVFLLVFVLLYLYWFFGLSPPCSLLSFFLVFFCASSTSVCFSVLHFVSIFFCLLPSLLLFLLFSCFFYFPCSLFSSLLFSSLWSLCFPSPLCLWFVAFLGLLIKLRTVTG